MNTKNKRHYKYFLSVFGINMGMFLSACAIANQKQKTDADQSEASHSLNEDRRNALNCLIADDMALIAIFYKMSGKSKSYVKKKVTSQMPLQLRPLVGSVVDNIYKNRLIDKNTVTQEIYSFLNHRFSNCLTVRNLNLYRRKLTRCRQFLYFATNIHRKKSLGWSKAKTSLEFSKALDKTKFKQTLVSDIYKLKQPFSEFWFRVITNCASNLRN